MFRISPSSACGSRNLTCYCFLYRPCLQLSSPNGEFPLQDRILQESTCKLTMNSHALFKYQELIFTPQKNGRPVQLRSIFHYSVYMSCRCKEEIISVLMRSHKSLRDGTPTGRTISLAPSCAAFSITSLAWSMFFCFSTVTESWHTANFTCKQTAPVSYNLANECTGTQREESLSKDGKGL
jgi:hypothetical protein